MRSLPLPTPTRARSTTLALLVLACLPWAQEEETGQEQEGVPDPRVEEAVPAPQPIVETVVEPLSPGYRFLGDRETILSAWRGSGLVEVVTLPASQGGRELFAVQFGGPGERPLAERTTVFLVGGLDGISLAGSEAVLEVVTKLLAEPDRLAPDLTYVAVPWANPDGLANWRMHGCGDGRNDRAVDDDGDGLVDEDGPDDLDGDGVILEMLVEDPTGPWVRSAEGRLLRPAREGEAPRFRLGREGRDEDGDGLFNEDASGGVVLDLNFPVGWKGAWSGEATGPWPLSEPASKALADLALARRTAVLLLFQGNHGRVAVPGGSEPRDDGFQLPLPEDHPILDEVTELFYAKTARPASPRQTLRQARERERPGAALDWFYAGLGSLALEVGVWGPGVGVSGMKAPPPNSPLRQEAWAIWLDDTRGGIGFVDWSPVELLSGGTAWVGGWEPNTCFNPPVDALPGALAGLEEFTRELAGRLPRLEIDVRQATRDGRLCLVRASVRNAGGLPTGVGPVGEGQSARLMLDLPPGVELVAGEAVVELGHLPGNGTSPERTWLLKAPEGTTLFHLVVESPWAPRLEREVRL